MTRRDLVGYGQQPPDPRWPNGARTALSFVLNYEEGGERYSMYYLQPRSQEDLRRRNRAHRKIADFCFGLMGRTPDAFAAVFKNDLAKFAKVVKDAKIPLQD